MTHKATQERYPNSEGNPASPRPEELHVIRPYDPDLIGPRDATDNSRGLLEHRARDLALVAMINPEAYEHERERLVAGAEAALAQGNLLLGVQYPGLSSNDQLVHFMTDLIAESAAPVIALAEEITDQEVPAFVPMSPIEAPVVTIERSATWTDKVRRIIPFVSRKALESFGVNLSKSVDASAIER